MTIIVTLAGGIIHTIEDVGYIDTESGCRSVPILTFRGFDYSTELAKYEQWLKMEVLP